MLYQAFSPLGYQLWSDNGRIALLYLIFQFWHSASLFLWMDWSYVGQLLLTWWNISVDILHLYSRLNTRPIFGGIRSRIGVPQTFLNRPAPSVGFQRTFDARQKIGLTDARHKIGVKDAREKLLQKDARFKIQGKVQDAREMLNSRKQQSVEKVTKVVDAREKISLKRSAPASAAVNTVGETVAPAVKITKTIQVGYDCPLYSCSLFVSNSFIG